MKNMLRAFISAIAALCIMTSAYADTNKTPHSDMPITNIHRLITSHTGWLNTSRALTPEDLQGRIILLDFWT